MHERDEYRIGADGHLPLAEWSASPSDSKVQGWHESDRVDPPHISAQNATVNRANPDCYRRTAELFRSRMAIHVQSILGRHANNAFTSPRWERVLTMEHQFSEVWTPGKRFHPWREYTGSRRVQVQVAAFDKGPMDMKRILLAVGLILAGTLVAPSWQAALAGHHHHRHHHHHGHQNPY